MEVFVVETQVLLDDFQSLRREVERGLSSENSIDALATLARAGYQEDLGRLRSKIRSILETIDEELQETFRRADSPSGYDDVQVYNRGEGSKPDKAFLKPRIQDLIEWSSVLTTAWRQFSRLIKLGRLKATEAMYGSLTQLGTWAALIMSWIKGFGAQLWKMLSNLLTVKEWKLSGELPLAPFGLSKGGLEITFRPTPKPKPKP